jgi:molecular chaperone GrpE
VSDERRTPSPEPRADRDAPAGDDGTGAADSAAPDVAAELDEARRQAEDYLSSLRRVAADFDNFKKRTARAAAEQADHQTASLVGDLLPVLDNLERALDASEHHEEAKVAEGVRLVHQQLADVLARRGVAEIETEAGDRFDPHVHEAISHQPSEHADGAIAAVWQRGYRIGKRIVRPSRVVVSSGAPAAEDAQEG